MASAGPLILSCKLNGPSWPGTPPWAAPPWENPPPLDENCCLGGNQQGGTDCAPRFPQAGGLLLLHLLLSRRGRWGAQSPPPPSSILYQVKHFQFLVRQSGFILPARWPSCGQTPVAVSHSELTMQQRVTTSSPLNKRLLGHSRGVCTLKAAPRCRAPTG